MRKTKSFSFQFLSITCVFLLHFQSIIHAQDHIATSEYEALGLTKEPKRETLEIIIGGGGGYSPAPSPEPNCPPPQPPAPKPISPRLARARKVLIQFAKTVKPNKITNTWNDKTRSPCDFLGILCGTYPDDNQRAVAGLDLNQQRLSASFGCLEKIQFLNLASNKFYGTVPESVCVLPGIKNNGNLSLSNNYFTAIDPSCWSLLKSKILDVSNNCIPGLPNQRSKKECYDFQCKIKPCSNHQSLSYVPCKTRWGAKQDTAPVSQEMAKEPVTYKSLKPHHRLRM
ncbi:hypothetical protein TSUD_58490 [Trifolium subterraneum]|uniref:Leucine-rich repeat-containing N-terminal plant-type domain-containing protein n=1 Tax=Trifolium subterraneum TaxID=3900 RepID=A0A2Z6MGW3_TRISU|nr:hypothetical protein TSUD_58490 [Trifolium subterraneum]